MLSWPDSVCERLAAGGQQVVRYDLRDCGASTTVDPEAPGYHLRDLAAERGGAHRHARRRDRLTSARRRGQRDGCSSRRAQPLERVLGADAGEHPTGRASPVDDDLPDHDAATMDAVFSRPMPDCDRPICRRRVAPPRRRAAGE